MPYRRSSKMTPRKKKKAYKKRVPRGVTSTAPAAVSYSSGGNILAPRFIGKMPWLKSYTLAAGTTDIVDWQHFIPSGCFDPEVAVSSAMQPLGWDQLTNFYDHYRVLGAKTTITVTHTAGNPMIVGIIQQDDASTTFLNTIDEACIDPGSNYKTVSNERPYCKLYAYYSPKKRFDKARQVNLSASLAANPAENWYHSFFKSNAGPGQAQASMVIQVRIDYIVECSERKILVKS